MATFRNGKKTAFVHDGERGHIRKLIDEGWTLDTFQDTGGGEKIVPDAGEWDHRMKTVADEVLTPDADDRPVESLKGIGPMLGQRLRSLGIATVADFRAFPHDALLEGFRNSPNTEIWKRTTSPSGSHPAESTSSLMSRQWTLFRKIRKIHREL